MRQTKKLFNPNRKKTNLSPFSFFMLLGFISYFLTMGIAVVIIYAKIEIPLSIPYSLIRLTYIFCSIGLIIKLYPYIRHWRSNFKCLYTPEFDEFLFRCGIFKNESDETVIIPLAGDNPTKESSKFYIYAPYDFSDQLLKSKNHINSFLAKSSCSFRIIDCYLDGDKVVYICQKRIELDRIDRT